MVLRCVLSAVCVGLLAPVMPAGARASDAPSGASAPGTSERPFGAIFAPSVQAPTRPEPSITSGAPPVITVRIHDDSRPAEPQVVERPKITCPMVVVAADPGIDPKFIAPPPKDMTFTMRSVAPPVCR